MTCNRAEAELFANKPAKIALMPTWREAAGRSSESSSGYNFGDVSRIIARGTKEVFDNTARGVQDLTSNISERWKEEQYGIAPQTAAAPTSATCATAAVCTDRTSTRESAERSSSDAAGAAESEGPLLAAAV